MNRHGCRRAQRMYRLLVRLYPAAHRRAFGEQMVQTFGDHYRDAVEDRGGSRLRFWLAVLADAGTSLLTEHAAEFRARTWRRPTTKRQACGPPRRRRVARRLRYRRGPGRRTRVVVQIRHHQVVYRGRIALLVTLVVPVGAGVGIGTATGHLGIAAIVTGLLVAAWLAYGIRLTRRVPAGPGGDWPAPPGGAGVREPRRPLPMSPAGAAARPMPDQDPPGHAVASI